MSFDPRRTMMRVESMIPSVAGALPK